MPSQLPPLTQAHATIQRIAPELLHLNHIVLCISDLLDVSTRTALPAAAARGSLTLVERIAQRLTNDQHLSPAMLKHLFGRAMQVAIENNNLAMVQKIHSHHPEPLVLYSLQLALKHGTLEMVQWIVEHRHDRLCCAPGIQNVCRQCLYQPLFQLGVEDALRIVQWLRCEGVTLSLLDDGTVPLVDGSMPSPLAMTVLENVEVLQWFDEQGLVSQQAAETLLTSAITSKRANAAATVEYLVARDFTMGTEALVEALIQGSCHIGNESVVEAVAASRLCDPLRDDFQYSVIEVGGSKVLQWSREYVERPGNEDLPRTILHCAINSGHLATIRWLQQQGLTYQHGSICLPWRQSEQEVLRFYDVIEPMGLCLWRPHDIDVLAQFGYLDVLQRLLTHGEVGCTVAAMDWAAAFGHVHVVKWLHSNRTEGCTSRAMERAAAKGHLEVVQWLCENRSEHNTTKGMACAAIQGQLEVLAWLHETQLDACASCAIAAVLMGADMAGRNRGALNGLRWLREKQPPSVACGGSCCGQLSRPSSLYVQAAKEGDIELLQYLFRCYLDSQPTAIRLAKAMGNGGHLPLIQWVHAHLPGAVDWDEVRRAASSPRFSHNHIIQWLDSVL